MATAPVTPAPAPAKLNWLERILALLEKPEVVAMVHQAATTVQAALPIIQGLLPVAEAVAGIFIKNPESIAIAGQVEGDINTALGAGAKAAFGTAAAAASAAVKE
jgi:hypothetical protein